ncbi:hypothetical protein FPV67DRAFT_252541 [Lyophyllum atratum]|nr:hypothetical protein FPV67DRAFT_252541 [Lyophyllum atratum]
MSTADRNLSDILFITMSENIRAHRVKSILLHAALSQTSADQDEHVHWRLYFQLDTGSAYCPNSVEFDLERSSVDGVTRLYITGRHYSSAASRRVMAQPLEIPMNLATLTIQSVIDLVWLHCLERYQLSARGDGCGFWCQTVLDDLADAGWVAQITTDHVRQYIMSLHQRYDQVILPYPLYQGIFY